MNNSLFVSPLWLIDGFPDYFFAEDKQLYRKKTNGKARQCKLTMVGYSKGYVLKSKFFSLFKLRSLLFKSPVDSNKEIYLAIYPDFIQT